MGMHGTEGQGGLPHLGQSAIYDAARFIDRVKIFAAQLEQGGNQAFDPPFTTLNIGTIQGGTAKNIVPGECRMLVEWRPIPGEAPDRVEREVSRILAELQRADPDFAATFNLLRTDPGFSTASASEFVTLFHRLTETPPSTFAFYT